MDHWLGHFKGQLYKEAEPHFLPHLLGRCTSAVDVIMLNTQQSTLIQSFEFTKMMVNHAFYIDLVIYFLVLVGRIYIS